jgi:nucleotide-binding universal stress UspA family protein
VSASISCLFTSLRRIQDGLFLLLPLDNTSETREKVPYTAILAVLFGASVEIITLSTLELDNVLDKLNDYALQVHEYLTRYNVKSNIQHINGMNFTDITIDFAKKKNADLIAVMTEQEKSITNILLGNYAHQMINKSPIPVLLFPTKQMGILSESFKTQGINY